MKKPGTKGAIIYCIYISPLPNSDNFRSVTCHFQTPALSCVKSGRSPIFRVVAFTHLCLCVPWRSQGGQRTPLGAGRWSSFLLCSLYSDPQADVASALPLSHLSRLTFRDIVDRNEAKNGGPGRAAVYSHSVFDLCDP